METVKIEKRSPLYEVRCTECGEVLKNRFFPLDNLLMQYRNGKEKNIDKKRLFGILGIDASYGGAVLPKAPPLLQKVGENLAFVTPQNSDIEIQSISKQGSELFAGLAPVRLNIASIVAQFCLMSGFREFYEMLSLQYIGRAQGLDQDQANRMMAYQARFKDLPGVSLSQVTVQQLRQKEIEWVLNLILDYAETEAADGGSHFVETLYVSWQYELVNNREMPSALVVLGENNERYNCTECCCGSCRKPVPTELGAYNQKIVGLLGTQATGKSTYLAALTDAIIAGEAVTAVKNNGELMDSGINVNAVIKGNANWARIVKSPIKESTETPDGEQEAADDKGGMLWLYQNGFPPEKTPERETLALSFLINSKHQKKEPVMYTLVDIAGEVFYNDVLPPHERLPEDVVQVQKTLLSACSALLFVVSSRQLKKESNAVQNDKVATVNTPEKGSQEDINNKAEIPNTLVKNPQEVLQCAKSFLPQRSLPMAVVLTSADEVGGGSLRVPFLTPYDIKNCRSLVWSDQKQRLVYNAEAMDNAISAVRAYVDKGFGKFVENLESLLKKDGQKKTVKLAAFAVSSGTQHAPFTFSDGQKPEGYHTKEQRALRAKKMRQSRFGVAAPLLWLLVCHGILEQGGSDYNKYSDAMQKKLQLMREKELYN